jgi:hypothetical protein
MHELCAGMQIVQIDEDFIIFGQRKIVAQLGNDPCT